MIINNIDIEEFKVKKWEIFLLTCMVAIPVYSFYYSFLTSNGAWFSRSGSLMVLIGAFVEYSHMNYKQYLRERRDHTYKPRQEYVSELNKRKKFDIVILMLLAAGTLIWGYGDLLF